MLIMRRTFKKQYCKDILCILVFLFCICTLQAAAAQQPVHLICNVPYSLTDKQAHVMPGGTTQIRIVAENYSSEEQRLTIAVKLPPGLSVASLPEGWVSAHPSGTYAQVLIRICGGYGHWFELLPVNCQDNMVPGVYPLIVEAVDEQGNKQQVVSSLTVSHNKLKRADNNGLALKKIILPLKQDGSADLRMSSNTLIVEDDYWLDLKMFLSGKGTAVLQEKQSHPIAYLGIEFANPEMQQALVSIKAQLLDKKTRQQIPGLIAATSDTESFEEGMAGTDGSQGLFALQGEPVQQVIMPIYADEQILKTGEYTLQVTAQEMKGRTFTLENTIQVIARNTKAAFMTILTLIIVAIAAGWGLLQWRTAIQGFKTRWLVTISLFGTAGFAVVNVPHTFLQDFFHIILGPFGFLVTGMFNGIILYMLIISLLVLIPRPGTAALMTIIRMLLSMLAFGHISPVGMLIYGSQAVFLEATLFISGLTRRTSPLADLQNQSSVQKVLVIAALACGIADSAATYVNLNALSFLYRLYYAEWYILLCVMINGFIYPAIGAVSGILLGKQMQEVGGE